MPAFAATYTYTSGSADVRAEHLADHLAFVERLEASGALQLVGRLDGASVDILFVLRADTVEAAQAALDGDPYAGLGVVERVSVHPWTASRGVLAPL